LGVGVSPGGGRKFIKKKKKKNKKMVLSEGGGAPHVSLKQGEGLMDSRQQDRKKITQKTTGREGWGVDKKMAAKKKKKNKKSRYN